MTRRLTDEEVAEIRATPSSWNELTVEGLLAELERERTQNLEARAALAELCFRIGKTVVSGPSRMAAMKHLMPSFEHGREVVAARAALSTQEADSDER